MRAMFACIALLLLAGPAHADQIDGEWCNADGKSLHIEGPTIRIPSGATITGDYDRHGFAYVGPAGDPEAGIAVTMQQQSDDQMTLRRVTGGQASDGEVWRRCKPVS